MLSIHPKRWQAIVLCLVALVIIVSIPPVGAQTAASSLPPDAVWVHTPGRVGAAATGRTLLLPTGASYDALQAAPNGSLLLFAEIIANGRNERLLTVNPQTGARRVLVSVVGTLLAPRLAPTGQEVAFGVIQGKTWQLRTFNLLTGREQVVRSGQLTDKLLVPVAWTPTGLLATQIIWASSAPAQNLFLVNPGKGTLRRVYRGSHYQAVASADGKRVALVGGALPLGSPDPIDLQISVLDVETGQATPIVRGTREPIRSLSWSPDRAQLAYLSDDIRNREPTLYVLNADGTGERTFRFANAVTSRDVRDVRWRDRAILLLLVGEPEDARLHLYAVPGQTPQPEQFRSLGTFPYAPVQAPSEILYTPR